MAKRSKLNKGEKRLLIVTGLFVIITTAITLWLQYVNRMPVANIPTPAMPRPNARDFYLKAVGAFVPYWVKMNGGIRHPLYFFNLSPDYEKPTFGKGPGIVASTTKTGIPAPSLAELQGLSQVNAPALAIFRQGLQYDCRETLVRKVDFNSTDFFNFNRLAQFLAVDAKIKSLSGDWNGAAQESLDIIQFGENIQRGLPTLGMRFGYEPQEIGLISLGQTIDHLNAAQARAAARRLEEIAVSRTPFADALREDKWMVQASLLKTFHQVNWRQQLLHNITRHPRPLEYVKLYTSSKRQIFNDYTRFIDAQIAGAKRPFAAAGAVSPLPNNLIVRQFVWNYTELRREYENFVTTSSQLRVRLAQRASLLEHGSTLGAHASCVP